MNQNSLKIIGKHDKINVKNFDNLEQFNDFYKLHEAEINKLSTVKLNQMYHIKDYKIARRKVDGKEEKILCFQQIFKTDALSAANRVGDSPNDDSDRLTELEQRIKTLELENNKIKQQLIEIINAINAS